MLSVSASTPASVQPMGDFVGPGGPDLSNFMYFITILLILQMLQTTHFWRKLSPQKLLLLNFLTNIQSASRPLPTLTTKEQCRECIAPPHQRGREFVVISDDVPCFGLTAVQFQ